MIRAMEAAPVSVVIPVRNGERYLAAALDSVCAQTLPPAEIIVVDDASTDATRDILAGYGSRIQILHHASATGPAQARNAAVRRAQEPWIAFLDADDLWEPAKLERQVAFARQHLDFGVIGTDVLAFDDQGSIVRPSLRGPEPNRRTIPQGQVLTALLRDNWIATSAALVPRQLLLDCGGFDERPCRLGEDWVTWMHIAARHPVYWMDELLTRRRVHEDSLGHSDSEATFADLLRHLEHLQQEIPELNARSRLMRRAAYEICVQRAIQDFHHFHPVAARRKLMRARDFTPAPIRAGFWRLLTYMPAPWLRLAKRLKRRAG